MSCRVQVAPLWKRRIFRVVFSITIVYTAHSLSSWPSSSFFDLRRYFRLELEWMRITVVTISLPAMHQTETLRTELSSLAGYGG
jgi:hypothetical protein